MVIIRNHDGVSMGLAVMQHHLSPETHNFRGPSAISAIAFRDPQTSLRLSFRRYYDSSTEGSLVQGEHRVTGLGMAVVVVGA